MHSGFLEAPDNRLVGNVVEYGLVGVRVAPLILQAVMPGSVILQLDCQTSQSAMVVNMPCSATW